jgi:hypothetical protein
MILCHLVHEDIKRSGLCWLNKQLIGCSLSPRFSSIKMEFGSFALTQLSAYVPSLAYKKKAQRAINVFACRQVRSSIWQSWHVQVSCAFPALRGNFSDITVKRLAWALSCRRTACSAPTFAKWYTFFLFQQQFLAVRDMYDWYHESNLHEWGTWYFTLNKCYKLRDKTHGHHCNLRAISCSVLQCRLPIRLYGITTLDR